MPTPEEQLAEAKRAFQVSILEDDLLFQAIQIVLEGGSNDLDFPEFSLEPWCPSQLDLEQWLGLIIAQTHTDAGDGMVVFTQLSYRLPVVATIPGASEKSSGELSDAVKDLTEDEKLHLAAFEHFMAAYRAFTDAITGIEIHLDGFGGSFEAGPPPGPPCTTA